MMIVQKSVVLKGHMKRDGQLLPKQLSVALLLLEMITLRLDKIHCTKSVGIRQRWRKVQPHINMQRTLDGHPSKLIQCTTYIKRSVTITFSLKFQSTNNFYVNLGKLIIFPRFFVFN